MQELSQDQINHSVNVILLKKIIELLDKEETQPETLKADEVRAALRNELSAVVKAVKGIPQDDNTDILKELKNLKKSFESIDFKPTINVAAANVPDVIVPEIIIPKQDPVQVNYTLPEIHIPAPVVNLPAPLVTTSAPIVNIPETDLSGIINALDANLNKIRTNSVGRPLAVRLSDGQNWLKEIRTFADKAQQAFAAYPGPMVLKSASGSIINPATEEGLKGLSIPTGVGTNGTVALASADTWYAVPSTVPTSDYVLIVTLENSAGTIRWGYDNTGTPSATNGLQAPSMLTIRVKANQSIYYASSTAGDDVNWSTKVI